MAKSFQNSRFLIPFLLILATVIGGIFRLTAISANPPSLYSDEADIATQAMFFNQCRSDYFGNKFPVHFHSFADYQPGLYIYLTSLSQKIFSPGIFSTRFPAAVFGILTIPVIFLFTQIITQSRLIGLISAFLLAINPWHIHYSRTAFAVSLMLFFLLLALYYFFKFLLTRRAFHLALFAVFSVISFYTYSTSKVFVLIYLIILTIFAFKKIFLLPPLKLALIFALSLLLTLPIINDTLNGKTSYRFSYISIFTEPTTPKQVDYFRFIDALSDIYHLNPHIPTKVSYAIHNKATLTLASFISNYTQAFSTDFLFLKSDLNLRHGFSDFGYFYLIDFIFLVIGVVSLFKLKNTFIKWVVALLVISPIPSALTRDVSTPHGTRLILMLPFLIILISVGIRSSIIYVRQHILPRLHSPYFYVSSLVLIYLISFYSFIHFYYFHYPHLSARSWHYGVKETIVESLQFDKQKYFYSSQFEPATPFFMLYSGYFTNKCNYPGLLANFVHKPEYSGLSFDDRFYFGQLEWNAILKDKNINNYVFTIPQYELPTLKSNLASSNSNYTLNILKTLSFPYETTEKFIILSFNAK